MKPIDINFVAGKSLSDYGLENSDIYPLKQAKFEGNVLKLDAFDGMNGELIINLNDSFFEEKLKIKVKNSKGEAITQDQKLIDNEYVDTIAVGPAPGAVIIFVPQNGHFEMSGFSIISR